MIIIEDIEELQNSKVADLVKNQRVFGQNQNQVELEKILPRQSIFYKESELDDKFCVEDMKGAYTSTFVKGHNRRDLIDGLDGVFDKEKLRVTGGKVVRFESMCMEALFNAECLPKYGA